jgi:hypothetical protein
MKDFACQAVEGYMKRLQVMLYELVQHIADGSASQSAERKRFLNHARVRTRPGPARGLHVDGSWLTYSELGVRLGTSAEGARRRAMRARWARTKGNDGRARVCCPDDVLAELETRRPDSPGDGRPDALADRIAVLSQSHAETVNALREHNETLKAELERRDAEIETLKAQLAAAEARASEEAARTAQGIAALEDHNATLKADVEALKAQLLAAEARAEKQAAEFAARDAERLGDALSAERQRTAQTIAAFERLAERLEAMAAKHKPWWRRIFTAARRRSPASA